MNKTDFSDQLPLKTIAANSDSCCDRGPASDPMPSRTVAPSEGIDANSAALGAKQQRETEIAALVKAAADAARQTKAELCGAVMALQKSVRGQTDPNANRD